MIKLIFFGVLKILLTNQELFEFSLGFLKMNETDEFIIGIPYLKTGFQEFKIFKPIEENKKIENYFCNYFNYHSFESFIYYQNTYDKDNVIALASLKNNGSCCQ